MFDDLIKDLYLIPFGTFLVVVITIYVNNKDITQLEWLMLTNFKKLQVKCSRIFVESLISTIIFFTYVYLGTDNPPKVLDNQGELNLLAKLLGVGTAGLIVFGGIFTVVNLVVSLFKKKLFPKIDYYTYLNEINEEKWYLLRRSSSSQILLVSLKGEYRFCEEWINLTFTKEYAPLTKFQTFIYSNEKRFNIISGLLYLLCITVYVLFLLIPALQSERDISVFPTISLLIVLISFIMILILHYGRKAAIKYGLLNNTQES